MSQRAKSSTANGFGQASGSNARVSMEEDYANHSTSQTKFEESSTEQYRRKLQTPNPILDGGTGSGGAALPSSMLQA